MVTFIFMHICLLLVTSFETPIELSFKCKLCQNIAKDIDKLLTDNSTIKDIEKIGGIVCELKKAGGNCDGPYNSWQCEQVCDLAVQTYQSLVDNLLLNYIHPSVICYTIHNNIFNCPKPKQPDPTPVPNIIHDESTNIEYNTSTQYGYIVQIPDLHWDMQYCANSVANCGEPVCCRFNDNNHSYSHDVMYGGIYGIANESAMCDTPYSVIQSMIKYIQTDIILNNSIGITENNLDFIVFVGDVEAHDIYNQTQQSHLNVMRNWINELYIGLNKYNIPIFFDLGNHEGLPVNNFGGPDIDKWFNKPVANWLKQWIDTKYCDYDSHKPSDIMTNSGYYSSLIRPGFRLISINTGYIASDNFYLTFTQWTNPSIDIGGQYKWLNYTLYQSKYIFNETVVIIVHHPIKSALQQFENMYYNLYVKYKDIILIIFAGHTHVDHFHILGNNNFRNNNNNFLNVNQPFTTWFSPGSITQIGGRNPAFRVFKYDRINHELINYYQYRFDTNKSNKNQQPYWFMAYDAINEYGMKNISPQSMSNMAYSLAVNDTLWNRFEYNYYNGIIHSEALDRNSTICDLLSATNQQFNQCVKNLFKSTLSSSKYQQLYWSHH